MKLTNYVLIRFSLRLKPEWAAKAYGDESNRDAWFGMRAKIFKEYLYQSLSEQTTPPYKVIVFMDEGDADLWAKHLNLPPPFSPHYCSGNNLNENTRQILLSGPQDNIVLSRIDSDDAISRDYLESINASAMEAVKNGNNKKHIVAANGFITNLNEIQAIYYNCSPFISLYVRSYDGEVIYDIAHETILSRNPLINLGALWMQVVHGTNVANRLHMKSRFEPDDQRKMNPGPIFPADASWPISFPPLCTQKSPDSRLPTS